MRRDGELRGVTTRRSVVLEAQQADVRQRLVLAADDDRRAIERDLHDSVQQHLIALAVNLQLAAPLIDDDPAAARELIEQMRRDVQQALDDTTRLAQRIYPALLEAGGLAAALRAAAVSAGLPASVEVAAGPQLAPEIARTVCLCWLEALDGARGDTQPAITVREEDGALLFDVVSAGDRSEPGFDRLRERCEALGGRMTVRSDPGGAMRASGSLPLGR